MYNLKKKSSLKKSSLIVLVGVVSYLYLFSSLLNRKYDIIFIYFTILFAGYFIIGNKIFLYNILIIIFDILNKKFIIREGNKDFDEQVDEVGNTEGLNKETAPTIEGDETDEITTDDADEMEKQLNELNE
jgi:hypothetical protein